MEFEVLAKNSDELRSLITNLKLNEDNLELCIELELFLEDAEYINNNNIEITNIEMINDELI